MAIDGFQCLTEPLLDGLVDLGDGRTKGASGDLKVLCLGREETVPFSKLLVFLQGGQIDPRSEERRVGKECRL